MMISILLEYIPRSEITDHVLTVFNFLRNVHTFPSGCAKFMTTNSAQFLFSPHPHQHSVGFFLIIAILMGMTPVVLDLGPPL